MGAGTPRIRIRIGWDTRSATGREMIWWWTRWGSTISRGSTTSVIRTRKCCTSSNAFTAQIWATWKSNSRSRIPGPTRSPGSSRESPISTRRMRSESTSVSTEMRHIWLANDRPPTVVARMLTNLMQDVRFAARALWRNRGFAASAILILTLGIAASTGLFAVIDAVVLHPLPYAGADRIARVRLVTPSGQPRPAMVSADEFRTLRTASTLDGAYIHGSFTKTLGGASFPESVWI